MNFNRLDVKFTEIHLSSKTAVVSTSSLPVFVMVTIASIFAGLEKSNN